MNQIGVRNPPGDAGGLLGRGLFAGRGSAVTAVAGSFNTSVIGAAAR